MNYFGYQVFSRPNDINGNSFRLVLIFDKNLKVVKAVELGYGRSNYLHSEELANAQELPSVQLIVKEYKLLKKRYSDILHNEY